MRHRRLWTGAICGLLVLAVAAPAFAVSWAATGPNGNVEICFKPRGLSAIAIQQAPLAAATWNAASVRLKVTAGPTCSANARVIPMVPGPSQTGELATTYWQTDSGSGHMVDANMNVVEDLINKWGQKTGKMTESWRMVLCHEMGHALGLKHSTDKNSCMQTGLAEPVTFPAQSDFTTLRTLYGGTLNQAAKIPGLNGFTASDSRLSATKPATNQAPAPAVAAASTAAPWLDTSTPTPTPTPAAAAPVPARALPAPAAAPPTAAPARGRVIPSPDPLPIITAAPASNASG